MAEKCDPVEFLTIANFILSIERSKNDNIYIRTAIGRAYYASFLCCWEKLSEIGIKIENNNMIHQNVISTFMKVNSSIADLLDQLREERVKADYFMHEKFTHGRGTKNARLSEKIISLLSTIKNN